MLSLYSSLFNIENGLFSWKDSLESYLLFFDEVIIATTTDCKDNTVQILSDYVQNKSKIKLVITNISFEDYSYDGLLKNAALQACSNNYCCLLDFDEFIPLSSKDLWVRAIDIMESYNTDGLLIPSVNLCGSLLTYSTIGYKFYLHKKLGMKRGIWNRAKLPNGKMDIKLSDSTELLRLDGELAQCLPLSNKIEDIRGGRVPFVFHKWAVDFDTRIGQNLAWKQTWNNRAGYEVSDIVLDKAELEKIPVYDHNLSLV